MIREKNITPEEQTCLNILLDILKMNEIESSYNINEKRDGLCIIKSVDTWMVFKYENNEETLLRCYKDIDKACLDVITRVSKSDLVYNLSNEYIEERNKFIILNQQSKTYVKKY